MAERRHPIGDFIERHRHHQDPVEVSPRGDEPFPGYDRMGERDLVDQLFQHSQAELEAIEAYERAHGSRTRVLNKLHYLRQREPIEGYDAMSSEEVAQALEGVDLQTIKDVRAYERKFHNRPIVLEAVERNRRQRVADGAGDDTRDYHATSYGPSVAGGSRSPRPGELAACKELVARFYEEVINGRDAGGVERLLSEDFVHNGERRGRDGQRRAVQEFLDAFPDLRTESELILAEGDLVAAHQRWSGTHEGTIAGVEPTGRRVEFTSTAILRIHGGLITEAWDEVDLAGLLGQLRDG
jgi:predicted ester cyclase